MGSASFTSYTDLGQALYEFGRWLSPLAAQADVIAVEEPLKGPKQSFKSRRTTLGLHGELRRMAYIKGLEVIDQPIGQIKKLIYGQGGKKPAHAVELANRWGFEATNHDEADAAGVFLLTVKRLCDPDKFNRWAERRDALLAKNGETLL
jgi:hypothetical protein